MGLRPRPALSSALYTSSFRAALPTPSCWWVKTTRVRCVVDIHIIRTPQFLQMQIWHFLIAALLHRCKCNSGTMLPSVDPSV